MTQQRKRRQVNMEVSEAVWQALTQLAHRNGYGMAPTALDLVEEALAQRAKRPGPAATSAAAVGPEITAELLSDVKEIKHKVEALWKLVPPERRPAAPRDKVTGPASGPVRGWRAS